MKAIVRQHVLGVRNADLTRPTAVLNQVLLRLSARVQEAQAEAKSPNAGLWANRQKFLRHIVITARSVRLDALRSHFTEKRGKGTAHVSIHEGDVADRAGLRLIIAQIALDELETQQPELHRAFVLRKDFNFTYEAIADALDISVWQAREYIAAARKALGETMAATQPESAYRFIRELREDE